MIEFQSNDSSSVIVIETCSTGKSSAALKPFALARAKLLHRFFILNFLSLKLW